MDTRTRRASWDEPRIGIPEVAAVDRVDSHAKASSYGIRLRALTIIARICENPCGLISSPVHDRNARARARLQRTVERETKSRHAVKRDG
jgi:hypothetical protein